MEKARFSCTACGKTFEWKLALAGKRAKCKCGAIINVPAESSAVEPPPDELYDFAEPAPQPAAPPRAAAAVSPIAYQAREPEARELAGDNFVHKPRDFYLPVAALACGYLALLAWAVYEGGGSTMTIVVFSVYLLVATFIKTAVMIGAAFVIAPMAGVSFGGFWTAVLKLAALVVFTDAGLFWLQAIMEATGAYPTTAGASRRSWGMIALVNTLLATALIAIMLRFFFDMDRDEVGTVALPLAIINRVLNFLITLVLVVLVEALTAPAAAPPVAAPPAAPATPGPASATPTPAGPPVSAAVLEEDRTLDREIAQGLVVREAREFYQSWLTKPKHKQAILALYDSGPKRIYLRATGPQGGMLHVHMPEAPAARAAVISAMQALARTLKVDSPIADNNGRFVSMPIPAF